MSKFFIKKLDLELDELKNSRVFVILYFLVFKYTLLLSQ
jgi:hypothetical protein